MKGVTKDNNDVVNHTYDHYVVIILVFIMVFTCILIINY